MNRVIWGLLFVAIVSGGIATCGDEPPAPRQSTTAEDQSAKPTAVRKELLSGQVKFLGPALRDRGVKTSEEMDKQVVLITDDGEFVPLVADWRGRAFYQDEHLRDRKVQLIVRRQQGIPYAQVLVVYTFDDKGRRMYTDYWCDICSIPMYEIKKCDCCQGPIHLRFTARPLPSYLSKALNDDAERPSNSDSKSDDAK